MYKKMLVPLDGSKLAEVVLPYAQAVANRLDLNPILLHVCNPAESELLPMHQAYVGRMVEKVKGESEQIHKESGVLRGSKTIEGRGEVVLGYPAEEILDYAEHNDIDIILMATHGRSGSKRWVLGSVADKVLRESKIPICLVRAAVPVEIVYDRWPIRTILVPLDGSKLAESVIPHIKALVKQRGTQLVDVVLLRVCEPPLISADYPEASMPLNWEDHIEDIKNKCMQMSEKYLLKIEKKFKDAGLRVSSQVLTGKPADEIIDYAHRNQINLIVMAIHGRSEATRWAYGSVADKVLHGVSSPLLLVRSK